MMIYMSIFDGTMPYFYRTVPALILDRRSPARGAYDHAQPRNIGPRGLRRSRAPYESPRNFPAGTRGERGKKRNRAYQMKVGTAGKGCPPRHDRGCRSPAVRPTDRVCSARPCRQMVSKGECVSVARRPRPSNPGKGLYGTPLPHADVITSQGLPWCMFRAESRPGET